MGTIVTLGILGLIALIFIALAITNKGRFYDSDVSKRAAFGGIGAGFTVITLIVFVLCSMTNTSARTVGIVTEFGKATGTVSPGLNWVAPWADVTEFPTSNQTLDLDATDNTDEHKANPVVIKFLGGGEGDVNVNITWQVQNDDKAVQLWNNWKDFELVKANVVNPRGQSAVAEVFGALKPEEATDGAKIPQFNKGVQDKLNAMLASSGITVESVAIKRINVSPAIQDRINKQVEALADQQTATTKQGTAKIEAETNNISKQQLDPNVLAKMCYDVTNNWNVAKNGPLPANWSCTGGSLPMAIKAN
jgi:regulator of protease activity HflC (stomatin/prohibitin superfamily)